ncbi:MAG: hypothetical protein RMJ98_10750 [Myxococcales bacterium]|nr:hypothetical protein [Myxococcales bacterium]
MSNPRVAECVLAALRKTPIGDAAVLVGSSGLFGFTTTVPALTEDIDVAIPEELVQQQGREIVENLTHQGFVHEPGTATFVGPEGMVFDLLGYGDPEEGDHIGGVAPLRVMVFEDLSRIVGALGAIAPLPQGGQGLTPAGFVVSKLLTERAHKGTKDKIQALLVLEERAGQASFEESVSYLFRSFEPFRLEDVRASAHDALLALGEDPHFHDAGAEGYASVVHRVQRGYQELLRILGRAHG